MSSQARYFREKHASHGAYGQPGWDLECWDVAQAFGHARPSDVPADATRDYGYVDALGLRHTVYRRLASLSDHPSCRVCQGAVKRALRPLAVCRPENENGRAR
jgi:hypothetical protein